MLRELFKRFSGRHYRKFVKECEPVVAEINRIEVGLQGLSDDAIRAKTVEFKERYAKGETLDQLLPEAFAVVKNVARRLYGSKIIVCEHELTWDMIHYDVQLIGGMALHKKKVAEMATGEGKTLVATLPLYLNALTGMNCQLVTVNDYLARRDAEWMGYVYKFLGLTVGCIQNSMDTKMRQEAYKCDITYGTSSEFGFDYLRDNGMATRSEDQVQRDHYFCIIDEADSVLIDEARTPLIISGTDDRSQEAPFKKLRDGVEFLVSLQAKLCNRLVSEAKEVIDGIDFEKGKLDNPAKEKLEEALEKLYKVSVGTPKNRQFLRILENGKHRKQFDKFALEMNGDVNRERAYRLKEDLYFSIEERHHQADLTEKGRNVLRPDSPDAFVLPDLPTIFSEMDHRQDLSAEAKQAEKQKWEQLFAERSEEIHCLSQLLRGYCLYDKDVHYVVMNGKVMIVDEHTGRVMTGRRWSEGLHQAVEAKENVEIERESKTYATITIQNYFRMYEKLSGMTGTAETEASEFHDIYRLDVMVIPTHRPCVRVDDNDVIYKTRRAKYNVVIKDIQEAHQKGQPVLVGTSSVESSELVSKMLKRVNIAHTVLNAKFHAKEADIIACAGQKSAVTIATNMAGRGTDIKLGEGIAALGGLFVLGTERHESRRIDRQLRGRCARQGDPGKSKFFVSLEDDLMRLFANAGPIGSFLEKSMAEDEELAHPLLNRSIESAQKKVEQHNYSIRRRLLQYDDVLNRQREIIYGIRNEAITASSPRGTIFEMLSDEIDERIESLESKSSGKEADSENFQSFLSWLNLHFPVALKEEVIRGKHGAELKKFVLEKVQQAYQEKEALTAKDALGSVLGPMEMLERYVLVSAIDKNWQDHLTEMEDLRHSVGLRGYGQKDPLSEYKNEAYGFFEEMMKQVRHEVCMQLFRSNVNRNAFQQTMAFLSNTIKESHPTVEEDEAKAKEEPEMSLPTPIRNQTAHPKVGRNDPCPCGSGKKYKKCCGIE